MRMVHSGQEWLRFQAAGLSKSSMMDWHKGRVSGCEGQRVLETSWTVPLIEMESVESGFMTLPCSPVRLERPLPCPRGLFPRFRWRRSEVNATRTIEGPHHQCTGLCLPLLRAQMSHGGGWSIKGPPVPIVKACPAPSISIIMRQNQGS